VLEVWTLEKGKGFYVVAMRDFFELVSQVVFNVSWQWFRGMLF
jgi:hypothetical protein